MTKITFQDGKPVFRDGKVGTGQGCCCCPRCIRNGEWGCQYTTKESCEECVRTYECFDYLQTLCDGTCPEDTHGGGTNVTLQITSDCSDGYGAAGSVTVGCGKIISASVTNGGFGYARIARVAPTVTATAVGSGSGAVLSVTMEKVNGDCGWDYWRVASVDVVDGGSGYEYTDTVTLSVATGDTEEEPASVSLSVDEDGVITSVPVIFDWWLGQYASGRYYREDASAPAYVSNVSVTVTKPENEPGGGAVLTATVDDDPNSPTFGSITAISITNEGSDYRSLCERFRSNLPDCGDCGGDAPEIASCGLQTESGPCGDWQSGFPCDDCCDCSIACQVDLNADESTQSPGHAKYAMIVPYLEVFPWFRPDYKQPGPSTCGKILIAVVDVVDQLLTTGAPCANVLPGSVPSGSPLTQKGWRRGRFFLLDCRTLSSVDVTSEVLVDPSQVEVTLCGYPSWCNPDPSPCQGENPGYLAINPILTCQ